MRFNKLGKVALSGLMVGVISASTVLSTYSSVLADSNDRVATYIDLAAGKNTADMDIGNMNLSKRDLQFLGVFISNYYVPFGTELGELSGDEGVTDTNKSDIKKALQTNLKFSDSMASSLTENLLGLSRSSIKELTLYVSNEYQKDLVEVSSKDYVFPLNSYTATACMLGGLREIASWYPKVDSKSVVEKLKSEGNYNYGYFCYESNGKPTPVFDFNIDRTTMTASQSAFVKCLESSDMVQGYGFSFFDFTEDEMDNSSGVFKDLGETLTKDQAYQMSSYRTKINVDCFGNIIYMGGNHQYIAVPGCMNPYTWSVVDKNGNPTGTYGGTAYNMANIPSMVLQSDNRLFSSVTGSDSSGQEIAGGDLGEIDQEIEVAFTGQMGKGETWYGRLQAEPGEYSASSLKNSLEYVIDYVGGSKVGKSDFKTYVKDGTLYVKGKSSKLACLDGNRVTDTYLDNPSRDKVKADKMRASLKVLKDKYGISVSNNSSRGKGLQANIENIANIGSKSDITGDGSVVKGNESSASSRKGTITTDVLVAKLKEVKTGDGYALRRIRGDSEASLKSGLFNLSNDFRTSIKLAEDGYKEAYSSGNMPYNFYKSPDGIKADGVAGKTNYMIVPLNPANSGRSLDILDTFCYVDDLGAAHFDDSKDRTDYSTFNVLHYLDDSTDTSSIKESMKSASGSNGFTNTFKNIQSGKMEIVSNISQEATVGLYVTYAFAGLYSESAKEETIGKLGYMLNAKQLPEVPNEALILSQDAVSDYMLESIRDWMYYFLHPTEGIDYFSTWARNKLNGFMLRWHDDMVGTKGTGSINGTTKYRGFSGYVTTPELSDMPWTDSMLKMYTSSIPFFLIFMILAMLAAYVVGIFTLQKAIIGLGLFAVCVTIPPVAINSMVGTSNRFSSSLYGEKFTYWALVQHEGYAKEIDEAANDSDGNSYSNYLKTLYATNSTAKANQGSESVVLKWQAPKKMASLMLTNKDEEATSGTLLSPNSMLSGLLNSTYSGESYLDDEESVYMYRSYIDIANFSRYIHRGLKGSVDKQPINTSLTNDITSNWYEGLRESMRNYSVSYEADRNAGYANKNVGGSSDGNDQDIIRVKVPLSSKIVSDAFAQKDTIEDLTIDQYVGIPQSAFNFSIPMFNVGQSKDGKEGLDFLEELKDSSSDFDPSHFNGNTYVAEDYSGLAAYGLMSENPFYYFSWYLYEVGLTEETSNNTGYKNLLLGEDNAGFFYNTQGNGELKDFMDMRSLFTYIIPYLKQGNDIVREWDDVYGINTYEGVPTEEGHQNDPDIVENPELRQKYWHNLNVARLYNLYTPWVDIMYDCSYAKEETIKYLGEKYVVTDPLNPATYPEERPMIFSRSEMLDYGLSEKDLTKAERLILECDENMQERMFDLLNYHNFSDVVLDTAAAMNCAFAFNETFSENSLIGANYNIYPQAFELNNFSYDAFLRFILSSSTGESMLSDGDKGFYQRITTNSSMTTVISMLVLDILAVYIIPGLKMFFIVGIFLLSILIILMAVFKVDPEQKFIKRLMVSFLKPMFQFMLITCGMAWVVSLFMGGGNTAVTGSMKPTIALGDPVMVMIVMIVLNSAVIYLYFKILKGVWKDIIKSGKLVGNFLTGLIGSVAGSVAGLAKTVTGGKSLSGAGASVSSGTGSSRGSGVDMGSPNPRASQRGTSTVVVQKMEDSRTEDNERRIKKHENESWSKKEVNTRGGNNPDIEGKISKGIQSLKDSRQEKKDSKNN